MKRTVYELYGGPLNVWVEDVLTRDVLTDLWADPRIHVIAADGKDGVRHLVGANPRPELYRVYGIIDRDCDFDAPGEDAWGKPDCTLLRLPVHEFENVLLDFDVMSSLSKGKTALWLRDAAHARAKELLWWMVCKALVNDMRAELGAGFPGDAPQDSLKTLADAKRYVDEQPYWKDHSVGWRKWTEGGLRDRMLEKWRERLEADLQSDAWIDSFSGKELFRHLRSRDGGLNATPDRPPSPTGADRDLDFAKRIARRMRELGRVPALVGRLREMLLLKAGLK